jgi:hypothetical protein
LHSSFDLPFLLIDSSCTCFLSSAVSIVWM